jgi:hypothetical protein
MSDTVQEAGSMASGRRFALYKGMYRDSEVSEKLVT